MYNELSSCCHSTIIVDVSIIRVEASVSLGSLCFWYGLTLYLLDVDVCLCVCFRDVGEHVLSRCLVASVMFVLLMVRYVRCSVLNHLCIHSIKSSPNPTPGCTVSRQDVDSAATSPDPTDTTDPVDTRCPLSTRAQDTTRPTNCATQ